MPTTTRKQAIGNGEHTMGLNSTVLILNDGLGQLERNPDEFVTKLVNAINGNNPGYISVGNFANPVTFVETHHSSQTSVVAVGGNHASVLGHSSIGHHKYELRVELLKQIAKEYGYKLTRMHE